MINYVVTTCKNYQHLSLIRDPAAHHISFLHFSKDFQSPLPLRRRRRRLTGADDPIARHDIRSCWVELQC